MPKRLQRNEIPRDSKGYYRFALGQKKSKGGNVVKADHSLGTDYADALLLRAAYREVWTLAPVPDSSPKVWTDEQLARVQRVANGYRQAQQQLRHNAARGRAIADAAERHAAGIGQEQDFVDLEGPHGW